MLRIVVVEDEIKIMNGITALIEKLSQEYTVIGKAYDGWEGEKAIRNSKPDLVITDIKMPGRDGLEMIKQLRQDGINCQFVILSGHADFKFAQEALKLGSVDYLLKPITVQDLKSMLQKVETHIAREKEKNSRLLENYPLHEVVYRSVHSDDSEHPVFLNELERRMAGYNHFCILFIKSDHSVTLSKKRRLLQLIENTLKGRWKPPVYCYTSFKEDKAVMLLIAGFDIKQMEALVKHIWWQYTSTIDNQMVFAYDLFSNIALIGESLERVKEDINWSISFNQNTLLSRELIRSLKCRPFVYPIDIERSMVQKISSGNITDISKDIENLILRFSKEHYHHIDLREAMICLSYAILYAIRKVSYGVYEDIKSMEINDQIRRINSMNAYANLLNNIINQFKYHRESMSNCSNPIISNVLNIIASEYYKDISLEVIADRLNLTSEYLSSLFNKELGIRFTVYLTQYRINKAKELLLRSDKKIYEVSKQIGYNDVTYFCKVFKRYTGYSPKEYVFSLE